MATILEKIVEQTASDLRKRRREVSFRALESFEGFERSRRAFGPVLKNEGTIAIIAEIKKASPSRGIIREDFDAVKIAGQYQEGGASAISVLTDQPAFHGKLDYLQEVSKVVNVPLLRKDFIIDPYQVKEARAYGADAVLLIAAITEGNQLNELLHATREFKLEALVEIYAEEELKLVDFENVNILGANNRDLHTFDVDLHRGIEILHQAPGDMVRVSESGLSRAEDLILLFENEIDAALIGEYFIKQPDPGKAVRSLIDKFQQLKEASITESD